MRKIILVLFLIILITGCSGKSSNFTHSIFQTNGASLMKEYEAMLNSLLLKITKKLIKRNQKSFSNNILFYLKKDIKNHQNSINLPLVKSLKNTNFKKYLKIAFSKGYVKDRGDYLVVGLYKMFYWSFEEDTFHKLTALQYDAKKLQMAYEILQAIAWKIKVARDKNGNYLFLTWQNNWQVELEQRLRNGEKLSVNLVKNLKYIKNKKESLLSSSNLSYEVIFGKMIFVYERALKTIGVEPKSLGVNALKSILLML